MKMSEVYEELARMYASPHPDKEEERSKALKFFQEYFSNQQNKDAYGSKLKSQLQLLMRKQANMKGKFNAIILDKYWEKEYEKPVYVKPYNPNQI